MRYYFDTSALVKRYIKESGSEVIDIIIDKANNILVSALTHIETISAFRRLLAEENICEADYEKLKSELNKDFKDFTVLPISKKTLNNLAFRVSNVRRKVKLAFYCVIPGYIFLISRN